MLRKKKAKTVYLIIFFPAALALTYAASKSAHITERYYSGYLYRYLSQAISSATGIIPISIAELLVVAAMIFIIAGVVYGCIRLMKSPGKRWVLLVRQFTAVVIVLSIIYFSFVIVWGLNYHRESIASIANLRIREASVDELEGLCSYFIEKANMLREQVEEGQEGVMTSSGGVRDMLKRADKGYQAVAEIIPELGGRYGRPKGVILSVVLSYQGIGGIYFPFTGEANVNISGPQFMIPFTASHEMAHQRGFAREDEANYIGYLACSMHPDKDFQYSGTMAALQYSMNAMARQDSERYNRLRNEYSVGVQRDFNAWNEHCRKYDGFAKETSDRINDAYLQANAQRDGIKSYGRMVDLLLAHYRDITKVSSEE